MPHSHDIDGPGAATVTSHPQDPLLPPPPPPPPPPRSHSIRAFGARRRENRANSPSRIWLGFHKRTKTKAAVCPVASLTDLSGEKERKKKAFQNK